MLPTKLSFVDLETTGTSIFSDRIIEICILRVENNNLVREFSTLVNPETRIDPFIEKYTGITSEELETAPLFYKIKDEILEQLAESIFVAHNVRFDYGFVRNEFARVGLKFSSKHLCTVKLARLLYPGFKRYNLDSIVDRHKIKMSKRHRAYDDTKAIWDFYRQSYESTDPDKFTKAINNVLKRPSVPISISADVLDNLPECSGVYIFYGENETPLYIGKSINIKDRVLSHFSNDFLSSTDMQISHQLKSIESIATAGELGALLLESTLIKNHSPIYNRKLRNANQLVILKKKTNEEGYKSVETATVDDIPVDEIENVLGVFKSTKQAKDLLYQIINDYCLCPKLLNLDKSKSYCFNYQINLCNGACKKEENILKYNLRFDEAFAKSKIKKWPFDGAILIREKGETEEYFLIDKWCYLGSFKNTSVENEQINYEYAFDYDLYKILVRYLTTKANYKNIRTLKKRNLEKKFQTSDESFNLYA